VKTKVEAQARTPSVDEHIIRSADPGEARLRLSGTHVWAVVGYWLAVQRDDARVARDYRVPLAAVRAALAYYEQHKPVIDARLAANAA
jgi:uncharacterized protein (DUF433 family)